MASHAGEGEGAGHETAGHIASTVMKPRRRNIGASSHGMMPPTFGMDLRPVSLSGDTLTDSQRCVSIIKLKMRINHSTHLPKITDVTFQIRAGGRGETSDPLDN